MDLHIFDENYNEEYTINKISINWNGAEINSILELNKRKIRSKYLNIIHHITKINSLKFNYLKIKDISLIKMSLINEKNPFKSNGIFDCLKLLALEIIVKKNRVKKIYYNGKNLNLSKSLKILSTNYNLDYISKKNYINFKFKSLEFLKGNIFFFIQFIKNFNLSKDTKNYANKSIFSYFVHFATTKNKKFQSNLWGDLPNYLNLKKKNINWFHFYVTSNEVKNSQLANSIKNKFNLNKFENHNFINSYININDFFKSYKFFVLFFLKNIFIFNSEFDFFKNKYSKTNFCFFLRNDFYSSFFGSSLIYNIMNIITFENLLKNLPKQKNGLYIIENQSWEYCFIKLWKKYNHGKLSAYFNSTMRFWDLRYLKKKNEFKIPNENPDRFLINNYISKLEIKKLGYPMKKVFKTDALRYQKLKPLKKIINNKKILIVGDILFKETIDLLNFINNTSKELKFYKFYFKPHPTMTTSSIKFIEKNYKFLKIISINSGKFNKFEFVICSNGTSANLDCMIMKLNFCSIKAFNCLNLFPIEKFEKKFQVKDQKELIKKIKLIRNIKNYKFLNNKIRSKNKRIFI